MTYHIKSITKYAALLLIIASAPLAGTRLCAQENLSSLGQEKSIEEVIKAAHKAMIEGDWASAESSLRQAMRLEPKQGIWRIQFTIALGQQKKWKEVFTEIDTFVLYQAVDWILTINKKMADGKVAFVDTEVFGDEKRGISRYVKAVKEQKKVTSVANDIGVKLDDFAKKNKIALTYDISKFKGMRFERGNTPNVTSEFIAYYNGLYKD